MLQRKILYILSLLALQAFFEKATAFEMESVAEDQDGPSSDLYNGKEIFGAEAWPDEELLEEDFSNFEHSDEADAPEHPNL